MPSSFLIVPLIFVAGLVGGAVQAAPVPPPALAEAQLRVINHRFVDAHLVANIAFMETLTSSDFRLTGGDGSWRDRAAYLASMRHPASLDGVSYEDVRVRLFGPVAVLHGVFGAVAKAGQTAKVRYTDVYFWDGAAWRLVSAQNTPIQDGVAVQQRTGSAPAHASWQGQDPTGDDLAVLRTLNENYVKAFREADVAWYDAHLAPDYVSVSSDGSFNDRAATLADFAEPSFATYIDSFPVDKVAIRRFGDVVLIHAENAYERKDGRKGADRYTDIWFKQDGKWRCIAAHITTYKAPA